MTIGSFKKFKNDLGHTVGETVEQTGLQNEQVASRCPDVEGEFLDTTHRLRRLRADSRQQVTMVGATDGVDRTEWP